MNIKFKLNIFIFKFIIIKFEKKIYIKIKIRKIKN